VYNVESHRDLAAERRAVIGFGEDRANLREQLRTAGDMPAKIG
jgi:hypothetical protein